MSRVPAPCAAGPRSAPPAPDAPASRARRPATRRSPWTGRTPVALLALTLTLALAGCDDDPVRPTLERPPSVRASLAGASSTTFTQVSAGWGHSCGLVADGTVRCWGSNSYGEVTPPSGAFRQVAVGDGGHSCAVRASDRAVLCWGLNSEGQAAPPEGAFSEVAGGNLHSCGIRADGTLACWGQNAYGQTTPPTGTFRGLSAGYWGNCALRSGGALDGTLLCWGYAWAIPGGTFTQVDEGFLHGCAVTPEGTVTCWGHGILAGGYYDRGQEDVPEGLTDVVQVSAGFMHSCALDAAGAVTCWGGNDYGQASPPPGVYTQVSAGDFHSCAVRLDGSIACWGNNAFGQASPPTLVAAQAIAFTSTPPQPAVLGSSYAATATGGASGSPVVFTSLTPTVCAVGPSAGNSSTVRLNAVGLCTVAADQAGSAGYLPAPRRTQTFAVVYDFGASTGGGFAPPVSTTTFNSIRAGQSVPVKFDLGGDHGLDVLAAGYPQSVPIACPMGDDPVNVVPATTATAGASTLAYDATTGLYGYVWKTDREWAGSCRRFVLKLADDTEHEAAFQFTR